MIFVPSWIFGFSQSHPFDWIFIQNLSSITRFSLSNFCSFVLFTSSFFPIHFLVFLCLPCHLFSHFLNLFFHFLFFSNLMPVMYVTGYRDVCPPLYFSFSFNVFILFSCNCTFTHQTFMIFKTKTKLMIELNFKKIFGNHVYFLPFLFRYYFLSFIFHLYPATLLFFLLDLWPRCFMTSRRSWPFFSKT